MAALWTLPGGLLSLVVALVVMAIEKPLHLGGLEFLCDGPIGSRLRARGWAAFTFGWCRFYWMPPDRALREHEGRHIQQHLAMSVFMFPAYLACLVYFGYESHPMEVDARAHESNPT